MENVRKRINGKLVNNEKDYAHHKPGYMSQQIFDNNLIAISKRKLALKLNNSA